MMIYTSYFAMMRRLSKNIVPVAICGGIPEWYKGAAMKILAPKIGFFYEWKRLKEKNDVNTDEFYVKHFKEEVLDFLNANDVVNELNKISHGNDVALLCYEKNGDFCHRHLVAEWLRNNGHPCEEWRME